MKKTISILLSILSPFAAVPTGWAIYAGVIKYPAFPMNGICAILGAIGVISTSIAAGMLVTDIKAYNQGLKNKTEREELGMSTTPAWLIFGGCVLAEITLSLLIVVIPGALAFGVLVFPLMTAAGVFAFAVKYDLSDREADLLAARAKPKTAKPKEKPATAKIELALAEPEPAKLQLFCKVAGCSGNPKNVDGSFDTQASLNAHQRKHKPVTNPIGYNVSFEPVMKGNE